MNDTDAHLVGITLVVATVIGLAGVREGLDMGLGVILLLSVLAFMAYDRLPHRRRVLEAKRASDAARRGLERAISWCFRLTLVGLVGGMGLGFANIAETGHRKADLPTPALLLLVAGSLFFWLGLGLMAYRRASRAAINPKADD